MNQNKVVLAIDLGTTGNRVIAFSKDARVVAKSYYEFTQIFPKPGWVEHNPEEITATAFKALHDVIGVVGAENIACIGITNQRETTILWDRETGKPVYNAIVWQDRRTGGFCQQLQGHAELIKKKTGLFLDPYFSATKIRWLLDNVPGLRQKIADGRILFGTPDVWVLWNLTGGKTFASEPSNASRTLLFNINTLRFDEELLEIFGVPETILPSIQDSDSLFGHSNKSITGREIPIHGILGDQQASLFAHCGWLKGVIKNTYGTGLFLVTSTQNRILHSNRLLTTVAWKFKGEISYALEGSIFMGGAVIQWLRDNLQIIQSASESEKIAAALKDNEGVYFVPALQGMGAPFWNPNVRGLIAGLTRKATRETIVRAALESLAYQTRDVIEVMKEEMGDNFSVLKVDGGASQNSFLMQFQSDILGIKIERPAITETTALGAAGIAGISSGFWCQDEFRETIAIDRVFAPAMPEKIRESYYQGWRKALEKVFQD